MLPVWILISILVQLVVSQPINPGDDALPLKLQTLNGTFIYDPQTETDVLFFFAYDTQSLFLEAMIHTDDSIDGFITSAPNNTKFIFASYSKAKHHAKMFQQRFADRMDALNLSSSDQQQWWNRLIFPIQQVSQMDSWVLNLLSNWTQEYNYLTIDSQTQIRRLDARFDWLSFPQFGNRSFEIGLYGDACDSTVPPKQNITNRLALISRGGCSFFQKAQNAQNEGAIGIAVFSDQNDTVTDMNCCGDDCNVGLNVVGCMIKYEDGQQLIQLLQQKVVTVEYFDQISRGFYFSIDPLSKIREVGWLKFPSFQFFSWEAVWENYLTGLRSQLSASDTVIPLFTEVPLGGTPITVSVDLPDLSKFSELKIELELGCIGRLDTDCPIWDRLLSLTVCCGDPEEKECWNELGRWVTPFRRQVGHWLTDVTPLTPLLTSDTCHFNLSTDPWIIKPWLPTLNLRLSKGSDPVRPVNILPLFSGGVFNQSYNDAYIPRNFSVPAGTKKVEIVAVITGHGSDSENCGEFCPSSHHFIVNGNPHVLTFSTAGTATGCADVVNLGGVPNEHGTWLYGRGGWCDGRDVAPWVVDVTSELSENNNTITYFGWLNGAPPNPSSGFSVIDMTSHLVFWQ